MKKLARMTALALPALLRRLGRQYATFIHQCTVDSIGPGCSFAWGSRLYGPRITVCVGEGCSIARGVLAGSELPGGTLTIGDSVQINADVSLDATGGLTIGRSTLISEGCLIYTHDHGLDPRSVPRKLPKVIGENVWIGSRAILLQQCKNIGDNAIIGAGAVVSKDIGKGEVVVGQSNRVIAPKRGVE